MTRLALPSAVIAIALTFSVPVAARAQKPSPPPAAAPADDHSAHQHGAPAAETTQAPAAPVRPASPSGPSGPSVEELTAAMNVAIGPAKIEAMAALLNAMVAEQKACKAKMAEKMAAMMPKK